MTDGPRIWVRRVKIVEARSALSLTFGVAGFFRLEACNRYGTPRRSREWKQLITNQGLDHLMSGSSLFFRATVGIGTTPPSPADTTLENPVAISATSSSATGQIFASPYFARVSRTREFAMGAINNQNLTEVGIGPGTSGSPVPVTCRDLIRDDEGNPTTFPVAPDEILRVTHILQVNIPGADSDIEDEVTITGSGTHDITIRAMNANNVNAWFAGNGSLTLSTGTGGTQILAYETDTLVSIDAGNNLPGAAAGRSSASNLTYTAGTFQRDWEATWGLTSANFESGVGAIAYSLDGLTSSSANLRQFQIAFSPKIDKFAGGMQRILTLQGRTTIVRA